MTPKPTRRFALDYGGSTRIVAAVSTRAAIKAALSDEEAAIDVTVMAWEVDDANRPMGAARRVDVRVEIERRAIVTILGPSGEQATAPTEVGDVG